MSKHLRTSQHNIYTYLKTMSKFHEVTGCENREVSTFALGFGSGSDAHGAGREAP